MMAASTGIPKKKASGSKKPAAWGAPPKGQKGAHVELTEEDLKNVSGGQIEPLKPNQLN
jgi:bacteriocin-like protein